MTNQIVFYHNPISRGRIVHWMLEEVGAPYKVELLSFVRREHKAPAYLAINPMGKVPAIVHRDTVVTEAAAICAYLADAFPDAKLAPQLDDPARGTYFRWLFFGAGCVEPAMIDKNLNRSTADRASTFGYGTYEDTMNTLERAVSAGPFILGDRFSAADVYVGSAIGWGMMSKGIERRPVFEAYVARLNARPAMQRALAQCEAFSQQLKAEGR